jgi:CRP/FNR family transcriptional regulator
VKASVSATWSRLPDWLSTELLSSTTARHLKSGQLLFDIGDHGDGCYRLDKGVVKVALISPQATERIVALLGAGTIVGDLSMIDGMPRSASVSALTDCELRFISRARFKEVTLRHPEIYEYLVKVLAARLRETDEALADATFMTMKGRLARALLEVADHLGEEITATKVLITPMIQQRDLAAMAGIARENANRILAEWERVGLVRKVQQGYEVDRDRLEHEFQAEKQSVSV